MWSQTCMLVVWLVPSDCWFRISTLKNENQPNQLLTGWNFLLPLVPEGTSIYSRTRECRCLWASNEPSRDSELRGRMAVHPQELLSTMLWEQREGTLLIFLWWIHRLCAMWRNVVKSILTCIIRMSLSINLLYGVLSGWVSDVWFLLLTGHLCFCLVLSLLAFKFSCMKFSQRFGVSRRVWAIWFNFNDLGKLLSTL